MKMMILNSEIEFRNYIVSNQKDISNIIIGYDSLDEVIYFYSYIYETIIATKINSTDFLYYTNIYNDINKLLKLKTISDNKNKVLRLHK